MKSFSKKFSVLFKKAPWRIDRKRVVVFFLQKWTREILLFSVAGSKGCGKTSLIFTLTRGIFPGDFVPGRFEGWSIAAAATPKESLNDLRKVPTGKAYLVNLTFWEDRPRLNLWEKEVRERKELEEAEAAAAARKKSEERRKKVFYPVASTRRLSLNEAVHFLETKKI